MVAERLTPSDFDERYRKDMEGGYRPEVIEAKRRYFGDPARLSLEGTMATENEFNVGDVVMLKTGGPRMTVEGIGSALDEKAINCVWFDRSKRVRELRCRRIRKRSELIPLESRIDLGSS